MPSIWRVGRNRSATAAESMQDVFDIYTIIFLALAVFIFLRLRSVLGTRTGRERPPYDPYAARKPAQPATEKVIALPNRNAEPAAAQPTEPVPASERWKGVAAPGSALAAGLDAIASADSDFDAKGFVNGARGAYEMIVSAYAEGDRNTLKSLLSREVYEGFESAIAEREKRGETVESHFISIDEAEITHAEMRQRTAQVTMHFVSKLITATRDKEGKVIDGNAEKVADVTDSWTFARDVTSRDPNWKLVATEAGQ